MKPILTKERRKQLKNGEILPDYVAHIRQQAEEEIQKPHPVLTYADFKLFYDIGERQTYEMPYFRKRTRLGLFAVMALMEEETAEERRWLDALEEAIFDICGDYTWTLPAHIRYRHPMELQDTYVDLFAGETGFILAEILHMLEDKLDERIVWYADREIRRRIIKPYLEEPEKYECFWEHDHGNWAAVCACGVGAALFYRGTKEEVEKALPRLLHTMEHFKSGYGEDGCCVEGISYWGYGFGFYTYFADLLYNYTEGKTDLFADPKVEKMAQFPQNIFLSKRFSISFGDGSEAFKGFYGLSSYLHKRFDSVVMLPEELLGEWNSGKTMRMFRDLAWYDPLDPAKANKQKWPELVRYDQSQWYIRNTEHYSFAAKGGHNAEPHNHNDVGSFILTADDQVILCDLGAPLYTRQYFASNEERYQYMVACSRGHSVPIINDTYQMWGQEHCAQLLRAEENLFEISFEKAYAQDSLKQLIRRFDLSQTEVTLTDTFVFDQVPTGFVERFVTAQKPEVAEGQVEIADYVLCYDPALYKVQIREEIYQTHKKVNGIGEASAFMIDLTPITLEKTGSFTCVLKKKTKN